MKKKLGFEVRLEASRDDAIDKVTDALKAEGFGVLTRIEIDQAFQEKIGKKFRPYTILGACNPQLAHAALTSVDYRQNRAMRADSTQRSGSQSDCPLSLNTRQEQTPR